MNYATEINELVLKRQKALDAAAALKQRLIESDGKFYENEKKYRLAQIAIARGEKVNLKTIEKERNAILKSHQLTASDLEPAPSCPDCGDTGRTSDGKICRCIVKAATERQQAFNDLPLKSFKDFSLEVYSNANMPLMIKIAKKAVKYIDTFPNPDVQNLILTGKPGNGKTLLASCIAGEVVKKGYSAISMTALGFVNNMLAYHTTFDEDKMRYLSPVLDCDLFIIDDLGTESILKNVTLEYLYLVLNERMVKGKHTLITTNLTPNELAARYGERISSRMFDKKVAVALAFADEDLRNAIRK